MYISLLTVYRAFRALGSDYQRFKDNGPARSAAKAERKRLVLEQKHKNELAAEELRIEVRLLKNQIGTLKTPISRTEQTDVLGYYVHKGYSLQDAHRQYRAQLSTTGFDPSSNPECRKHGRNLRRKLKEETEDDRVFFIKSRAKSTRLIGFLLLCAALAAGVLGVKSLLSPQTEDYSGVLNVLLFAAVLLGLAAFALRQGRRDLDKLPAPNRARNEGTS